MGQHKKLPSNDGGKYLTSETSILSKSIVIRLDYDLFPNLVNFSALTIFKHEEVERGWEKWTLRWSSLLGQPHVKGIALVLYHMQSPLHMI